MTTKNAIHGTLAVMHIPVPFDDPEREKQAQEDSKRLSEKFGTSIRLGRSVYDWGYDPADGVRRRKPVQLKAGDLVRVFKTVTDGDVLWQGTVDYDRTKYHHGYQKGMTEKKWVDMFYRGLPAILTRKDGTVVHGALDAFAETGTEGEIWSVQEYGKAGYDGLNCLREGDKLVVYSTVRDGTVEWEGRFDPGPEGISNVNHGGNMEVRRQTHHLPTPQWLQMSWDRRPVIVTPR